MGQLPRSLVLGMGVVKQLSLIDGIYDVIEKVGVCLGGGFKYFFIFTPTWGHDPI